MPGKPDMRDQCKLAIDAIPDAGLGEALESLRAIADEYEFAEMTKQTWARLGVTDETDEEDDVRE